MAVCAVGHREDHEVTGLFPCFYGGGGSCAFHRRKFLQLGGFDELLAPFYLEDTDLGYLAWKRGWKVLYQPASIVFHEHRGTIGKTFSEACIQGVLKKNFLLFCWKNIHEWPRLAQHFFFSFLGALLSVFFGEEPGRATLAGFARATWQLPQAVRLPLARALARRHFRFRSVPAPPRRPFPRHVPGARGTPCLARRAPSSRRTQSARPLTAAASSCTTPFANSPALPKSTRWSCSITPTNAPLTKS